MIRNTMGRLALAAWAVAALGGPPAAGPAMAGPLSDLLLAPGVFARAPEGPLLRYDEARRLAAPQAAAAEAAAKAAGAPAPWREAVVRLSARPGPAGPVLVLARQEGDLLRPLAEFPSGGANPVLLYFLEGVVRVMAEATGGSPFYIRNRLRSVFAAAGPATVAEGVAEAVLTPFRDDPNRDRMGEFADLTLRLRFPPGDPARLMSLSAEAGGETGYSDSLRRVGE